jgi:tRNA 2-thiouridine synthesizing protein A
LKTLEAGQVLRILADDPAAVVDLPHFCVEQGHCLMSRDLDSIPQVYLICKGT